jgi:hypothetical protein
VVGGGGVVVGAVVAAGGFWVVAAGGETVPLSSAPQPENAISNAKVTAGIMIIWDFFINTLLNHSIRQAPYDTPPSSNWKYGKSTTPKPP